MSASTSAAGCADIPAVNTPQATASRQVLRADIPLVLVHRGVGHAGLDERVVALAAFAARAAVKSRLTRASLCVRIHARQREVQRNAELDAARDHLRLARARVRRVDS